MNKNKIRFTANAAMIAALYVALTWLCALVGLDKGVIQMRLSEALCVLPAFTGAAVPGLFVGCLLANLLTGSALPDIIFGSLATLIGALGAYFLRRRKWLVPLPTVLANTLIIPFVLRFAYGAEGTIPYFMLTVGAGEVISAYICGMLSKFAKDDVNYVLGFYILDFSLVFVAILIYLRNRRLDKSKAAGARRVDPPASRHF